MYYESNICVTDDDSKIDFEGVEDGNETEGKIFKYTAKMLSKILSPFADIDNESCIDKLFIFRVVIFSLTIAIFCILLTNLLISTLYDKMW